MKIVFLTIIALTVNLSLTAQSWFYNFEDAQKVALATNKLILVDFYADWCGPCKKMDADVWNNEEVQTVTEAFVMLKLDLDVEKEQAVIYGIQSIPYILIIDGNGKTLFQQSGYQAKQSVISMAEKYSYNTEYLRDYLMKYHNENDFRSSFRLAAHYQKFSIAVKKDVRDDFLSLTDIYFKEAEKHLKKSNLSRKEDYKKRIDLHEIQKYIILNKPNKAIKKLKKIKSEELSKMNLAFYDFLMYQSNRLSSNSNTNLYLNKLTDYYKAHVNLFEKI